MVVEAVMRGARRLAGAWLVAMAVLAPGVSADEVFLVGGGRIVGDVVERRADAVVIEVGAGRVTLPASRVMRVASGTSALSVYRDRASRLSARDVAGWVALGLWARDHDLITLASEAFQHVLAVDAGNETAHQALGHVRLGGQWMSEDESYRARGYVRYEGSWVTPDEANMLAAQRAAEAEGRRADREAAAREREAEARIRIAEAEAARAAAEAEAAASNGGIPYPWVFGPSYGPYGPYGPHGGVIVPPHRSGASRHGRRPHQDEVRVEPRRPSQTDRSRRPAPHTGAPGPERGRSAGHAGIKK
jgi:hypothetical protein